MFLLCVLGGILCGVLGQGLSSFEQRRNTVCNNDASSYLASCDAGTVIAVDDIKAGANLDSTNCPLNYDSTADSSCCQFKEEDCTFRLGEAFYTWFNGCSGRERCTNPGAQSAPTTADACGDDHLDIYGQYSQYLLMDYYCIESSILHNVCSATSRNYTGQTEFFTSPFYPAVIPSSNTDCTCSVEVDDCDTRIQIYILHLELSETAGICGQQSLSISDGADVQNLTCADKSFQGISMKETATNYITVQLQNSEQTAVGRFWLGFKASASSANVVINCPAVPKKTPCMTTSTSTSTTTSSMMTSTSTTSTATPTTTTHSVTAPLTTTTSTSTSTTTSSIRTSTSTTSTATATTKTHSVTAPVTTKSSTITSTATSSTGRTSITTTATIKATSETIDDKDTVVLTIVIVTMGCVLVGLIITTIVYCCFVRRRLKKMDIEVADLKEKMSGSRLNVPNKHSVSACNCMNSKHDSADDTYNTYNEINLMKNENKESITKKGKSNSSVFKTMPIAKPPSATKQITGQKQEKVKGNSNYRRNIKSGTKKKGKETRKQLTRSKQETLKTFQSNLSERLHLSKLLKRDSGKKDQNTKMNIASTCYSPNLDEKKVSKPLASKRNGKIRPRSGAKSKILKKSKTPSAKLFKRKRLLKREMPASSFINETLPEPNKTTENKVDPVKTDSSVEVNSCVTDTGKYENDFKTVDVKIDLPQNSGQVYTEDNIRNPDLNINKAMENISQTITDEIQVQAAGSDSDGAVHIQRQETETFVYENASKRKRYLKLHRILSSALGYSWSYKEVSKKKKLSNLETGQMNFEPKVLRVELEQDKVLVSENCDNFVQGEIIAPCCKIKPGVHNTEETRSEKTFSKKKPKQQRRLGATRIIPKSCIGNTDSNGTPGKAKTHKLKRCHWTHSKF